MPPIDLSQAEQIKRVIVDPVIEGVELRVKAIFAEHDARLHRVEDNQQRENDQIADVQGRLSEVEKFKTRAIRYAGYIGAIVGIAWGTIAAVLKEKFETVVHKILGH